MAAPSRAAARLAAAAPPLLALLLLLAMAGSAAAARPEPKGAKITLRAKWPGTPLLHEAAEFLADEDPALFWRFVEGWQASAPSQLGATPSPEQCWAGIRSAAAPHLSVGMARLLDASLAARQYSPRLEMFRQLADASRSEASPTDGGDDGAAAAGEAPAAPCCWALLGGKVYTAAAPLASALKTALAAAPSSHQEVEEGGAGAVYSFDHIYSPPGSTAPPLNITAPGTVPVELFAPVGSRCAGELHAVLAEAVARSEAAAAAATDSQQAPPRLAYAWRPVLGGSGSTCAAADEVHPCTRLGTEGPLVLPGYGVELALKNMEYNAQDDSKKPAGGEDKAAEEEAGDEEAAAQPEAEGGSEPEKAGASAPAREDGVMKVKLKALGLQAAQRVLNAAAAGGNGTAALDALQEAAQDFPRLVEQLSGLKYSKNLRLAVEGLQRFIPPGSQFLLLNGLVYGTRDFNLYSFLDVLRREVRLYDALRSAGLPPAQLREAMLLRGTAVGNNEPPRLRLPTDQFVLWVNDLERDERYASWPRELQTLLMPMYPGRLPTIARNVLTAVFLFDPATPAALEIGSMAHQLEQQGWPVRIGLVPVVPARVARLRGSSGARLHGAPSISEQMARLLSAVSHVHGATAVTQLLYEVRSTMPPDQDEAEDFGVRLWGQASMVANARWGDWSEDDDDDDDEDETGAAQVLKAAAAADNGEALAAIDAAAAKLLDGAAELAYNAGLAGPSRSGVLVFNGAVTVNDGNGWQGAIVGALQTQMQIVQEDIYMQRLTDAAKDVQEEILRLHGAIPRYNPRIMPLDGGGPGFLRISGESEEYPARQLALTGPLLGLNATAAPGGDSPSEDGLWVRYFGPQPSLVDEDDEGPQGSQQHLASVTHWVAADVTSRLGLRLVAAALQYRSSSGRVAVLVNSGAAAAGSDSKGQRLAPIERLMVAVSSGLLQTDLTDFADALDSILQQAEAPRSLSLEQLDELGQFGGRLAADLDALSDKLAAAAASQARFVRSALGLGPGACAVVTNGRLLELPPAPTSSSAAAGAASTAAAASAEEEHSLEPHDFELLELYATQHQYSEQVATLVRDAHQAGALAGADASAVAAVVSSALAAATPEEVDQRSGRVTDLVRRQASQRNALTLPRLSGTSTQGADAEGAPAEGSQPGDSAEVAPPPVVVHAVLNPLSKAAQRLAPLIGFLRELLDAEALVLLNPKREYDDMPLKTFYRYVLPQLPPAATGREDADSASAAQAAAPSAPPAPAAAEFSGLPPNKVLTLGMDEPESWLVEPVEAASDLDNLRLQELGEAPAMEATYELEVGSMVVPCAAACHARPTFSCSAQLPRLLQLDCLASLFATGGRALVAAAITSAHTTAPALLQALMLTGMCLDLASLAARIRDQIHPRGVQLELAATNAPAAAPPLVDTLVMSNLGYFQLKSRPGLWKLRLAPGRSQELYTIASSTGASSGQKAEAAVAGADAHQVPVALSSFSGKHMHLFLRKDADRLTEDVLTGNATDDGSKGSLWDRVSAWRGVGSGKGGAPARLDAEAGAEDDRETIHVFTVASGHMYERLQKIMILSATKRTPARIKFWFIKNYMSPQMKAFVPYMARKYDFDYEFVTYKWPSWLHKQTEKQRIIWAYKILFLDVLFPLGLKKVIFCDSDQVVRADLRELWHMDLQGAPYGYTPFCDNNRDMEGFRFWKQGFWKDHLQGKPYHISALYVVDLERFRQIAAGDRLRVMYDGLSKDPNSLSNLDQDLPNYAQHTVPIFSLPQEWLWCETWCGSDTRPQAKTIDLCNNPLTKEPKLQSARRIIAEWPALNREAEEFTAAVERVQRGELSEAALMEDQSLFHVKLTPMAEGVAWSSDATQAAQQASGSGSGVDSGGHDEL